MKLEDQVCSLELAKKLKELGVKQESKWYHNGDDLIYSLILPGKFAKNSYASFTVAELGEMLPKAIIKNEIPFTLHTIPDLQFNDKNEWTHQGFSCIYWNIAEHEHLCNRFAKTEANARAECLIYLIEKGYIKVGEKL